MALHLDYTYGSRGRSLSAIAVFDKLALLATVNAHFFAFGAEGGFDGMEWAFLSAS